MRKRILSAAQATGILHIGNYAGSIRNWLEFQKAHSCIFPIVDLHAITVYQKPEELRKNILATAAMYLACGIDPKENILFVQSSVAEHAQLQWLLGTIAKMSELKLMHQFKEKTKQGKESAVGLFSYPILMAADILLYKTEVVPVGEDQQQHIELARELARRFNTTYGETFVIPEGYTPKLGGRIMGLDDPTKKMSKSASSPLNYIALADAPDVIQKKIQRAVTDSGSEIVMAASKPALSNLLSIYSLFSGLEIKDIEKKYLGKGYGEFKKDLADVLIEFLSPIQEKYQKYLSDETYLREVLTEGAQRARDIAHLTLDEVKKRMGLGLC